MLWSGQSAVLSTKEKPTNHDKKTVRRAFHERKKQPPPATKAKTKTTKTTINTWQGEGYCRHLRLIVQTVWAIIRQGAYAEAHVDVEAALVSVGSGDQVVVDLVANDRAERPTRCSQ